MMLDLLAVGVVGLLFWHELRVLARRRRDDDLRAAAPVIAGVAVAICYLAAGGVITPVETTLDVTTLGVWERRWWTATRAGFFGAGSVVWLTILQATLGSHDLIEYDGRLLGWLAPESRGGR